MDPAGAGALIGISIMVFGALVCLIRERCEKRKKVNEKTRLVETKVSSPLVVEKLLKKKQTSMRGFFKENQASTELRTIRIS